MRPYVSIDQLAIDKALYEFVNREAMPGTGVAERALLERVCAAGANLAPRNAALLGRRDELQSKIDSWHRQYPGASFDHARYKAYLLEIGYLHARGRRICHRYRRMSIRRSRRSPDRSWWCRSAMRATR